VKRISLCALLLAGCASNRTETATAPAPARESFGLPEVRAPLVFPPDTHEVTLAWLVGELARLSGQELSFGAHTQQVLEQTKEVLELTTPVPADEVYAFVEGLLASEDFSIVPVKGGTRPVLAVLLWAGRDSNPLAVGAAVSVTREDLPQLRAHPALVCQLVLTFENIDSRQLQTQLRQLLADAGGQQVVPAGERSLILRGNGTYLYNLAHLLLEVDRASAARPPQPPGS